MNKKLVVLLFLCTAALLAWVSSGFSAGVYAPYCKDCHGDASVVHPQHGVGEGGVDCSECHMEDPPESPATSTCAGCHPAEDPGLCPLVFDHAPLGEQGVACVTCHVPQCGEAECETDPDCDDDLYCNGIESCSTEGSVTVCVAGEEPCEEGQECDEENDVCVDPAECEQDTDCDDADLCTIDACVEGACVSTDVDCEDDVCNPVDGACVECVADIDCDSGFTCNETINICEEDTCVPETECSPEAECGTQPDGCGGDIECGTCDPGFTCNETLNICEEDICVPETECSPEAECGTQPDGCGGEIECGTCEPGECCVDNICEEEETPDIDCACDDDWKNHGQYVKCVVQNAKELVKAGIISKAEKRAIVTEAARSDCGKKKRMQNDTEADQSDCDKKERKQKKK